jgi:hypothetical protein
MVGRTENSNYTKINQMIYNRKQTATKWLAVSGEQNDLQHPIMIKVQEDCKIISEMNADVSGWQSNLHAGKEDTEGLRY